MFHAAIQAIYILYSSSSAGMNARMFKSSDLLTNCPPVSGSGTGKIERKKKKQENFWTAILFIHCLVSFGISTTKIYHTETADGDLLIVWCPSLLAL